MIYYKNVIESDEIILRKEVRKMSSLIFNNSKSSTINIMFPKKHKEHVADHHCRTEYHLNDKDDELDHIVVISKSEADKLLGEPIKVLSGRKR